MPSFLRIGSLNFVENAAFGKNVSAVVDQRDPLIMARKLGIQNSADALFPFVKSTVTVWPYLLVARDSKSSRAPLTLLKKIRKKVRGRIGPTTKDTFGAYRRMFEQINDRSHKDTEPLRKFLSDKRRTFTGDISFARKYERSWKSAFRKSLPKAGRQFLSIAGRLHSEHTKKKNYEIVHMAISHILRYPGKWPDLWRGAFCYAFLRSVYGFSDIDPDTGKPIVVATKQLREWAELMCETLDRRDNKWASQYRDLIHWARKAKSGPPLKDIHIKRRSEGAKFMQGLRFHTVYRLYFNPTPRAWVKK